MRQIVIFTIAIFSVLLSACGNHAGKENEEAIISVTLEPLRYFTEAIAGDKFKVVSMVPKGSSPETYDPTPQQLVALGKSKAYLRIGYIGFEQTWMDKLVSNAPGMQIFDTSEGVDLIHEGECKHDDHHHAGGVEPHIWNSTRNAMIITDNIYQALCQLDSVNQKYYAHRLDSLQGIIKQTDLQIKELLAGDADRSFMIYHPALSYFARDYGLHQISIEEGGKEPSPAHLKELIDLCRNEDVHVIFVQPEFDKRNAEMIAKQTDTRIMPVNPLSYDWVEEMMVVARALNDPEWLRTTK